MQNSHRRKVFITDDHTVVRHALRTIIESSQDYVVIGESDQCDETIKMVSECKPDVLVLDLGLRGRSGIETLHCLRENGLTPKVLILSMHEEDSHVKAAISVGAHGYIIKDAGPKEILLAIDQVYHNHLFLPKRFEHLRGELENLPKSEAAGCATQHPLAKLSKREREVFYLLVEGKPNRVIAKQLFLSPRTVETHRARLIKKLGMQSTADLVRYAMKNNLFEV